MEPLEVCDAVLLVKLPITESGPDIPLKLGRIYLVKKIVDFDRIATTCENIDRQVVYRRDCVEKIVDNEVIGIDNDGCLIQWDDAEKEAYNSGETLEEFGINNLTVRELVRIKNQ